MPPSVDDFVQGTVIMNENKMTVPDLQRKTDALLEEILREYQAVQ